ncbi:ABC transporter substrate-binding protein [Natronobiforma cellulositropha]|uniref:ABC transporter substrate-binding protein n=1 Tax=Natronobiforma cellulositropha TaxID=1679076 RepID=UPI0021D60289|nr:ABC transporter substrate-binding protein [Natronobiforma cellulositropha]
MTGPYSRRAYLRTALGVSALGLSAGCLAASDDADPELTVALSWDVTSDTWTTGFGGVSPYFTNVYETLVRATPEMGTEPWLATDWEATDETTWEFSLREDVQFHDGEALTAADVVSSFDTLFERGSYSWLHLDSDATRALDEHTVEFTTSQPFPAFPEAITHPLTAIHRNPGDPGAVVATGPFAVTEREQGTVATEPFDSYWGDVPTYDLTFSVVQDDSTRALSLESGDADLAFELPRSRVGPLASEDGFSVERSLAPHVVYAGIHRYSEPTNDRRLRRALNHAISQPSLVDTVLDGLGEPARGPISPAISWSAHDEVTRYEYDPERARDLVDASAYDGETLELLVSTDVVVDGDLIAEAMQAAFAEVGVEVSVRRTERAAFFDEMDHADLSLLHYGSNNAGADYRIYQSFHTDGVNNRANYERDGTGLYNLGDEVDALIDRGHRSAGDEREAAYREAQRLIVEDAVVLPICYKEYAVGVRDGVEDLALHPIDKLVDLSRLAVDGGGDV